MPQRLARDIIRIAAYICTRDTDYVQAFDPVHPDGTMEETMPPTAKLGRIDESTLPEKTTLSQVKDGVSSEPVQHSSLQGGDEPDTVADCLNLDDIERLATRRISPKAWGYYFSAADDLVSKRLNSSTYQRILLRPRIFVDCTRCSTSTTILGNAVELPIFVSPAAMARLGHSDGEAGIARACAKYGAAQIISNNASMKPEEIVAAASPEQVFGWQLYVQDDRRKSGSMLKRISALPQIKFVVLTLDAPVPGKREHDERQKNVAATLPVSSSLKSARADNPESADARAGSAKGGVGKALFAGTAADLTWQKTLPWLAKHTTLPIVLKGVQTHEDAYIASKHSDVVSGIILSNHGGRAVDTAPPAIHTLLEIRKYCPEVFDRLEVFVDGGIKRGTDVVKALALGAKAVGIGRAALWGLGAGGEAGVERVFEILKAETETAMRLLGCEKVAELGKKHVNSRAVEAEIFDGDAGLNIALARSRL